MGRRDEVGVVMDKREELGVIWWQPVESRKTKKIIE